MRRPTCWCLITTENSDGSPRKDRGFSLIESLVAIGILGGVGFLVLGAFSFSIESQKEASLEVESARFAGEILEILRGVNFESLEDTEDGGLSTEPLSSLDPGVLQDLWDRLERNGLQVALTIRPYRGRAQTKEVHVTVCSSDIDPHLSIEDLPPGKILVKQTTVITQKGISR